MDMKALLPLLPALFLASCAGYTEPYLSPGPVVQTKPVLPYDGPSRVTVIDHGPVGYNLAPSYSSSGYSSSYSSGYSSGDSFESPYAWSFPDQYSPGQRYGGYYNSGYYGGYGSTYCAPVVRHYGNGHRSGDKSTPRAFVPGSDYGYSSYREATSGSSSRRRSR